jgi:hypothetical protein
MASPLPDDAETSRFQCGLGPHRGALVSIRPNHHAYTAAARSEYLPCLKALIVKLANQFDCRDIGRSDHLPEYSGNFRGIVERLRRRFRRSGRI